MQGIRDKDKKCETCWYWSDEFTSVCVNEKSEHCADFVSRDDCCEEYCKRLTAEDIREEAE